MFVARKSLIQCTKRLAPLWSRQHSSSSRLADGPDLKHFLSNQTASAKENLPIEEANLPYLKAFSGIGQKVFIETYGCQMNASDTEIIWSVMKKAGYEKATEVDNADIIFLNTCAIRENAESRVFGRLEVLKSMKFKGPKATRRRPLVGVLGCMAERLKTKLLEGDKRVVDIVAGPDSYRSLPQLVEAVRSSDMKQSAVDVLLSMEETYADIAPVRFDDDSNVSAYVTVMRGCDNMCSYCIVPFTRGRERSRPVESILNEIRALSDQGVKEVTLLGQNVNSYNFLAEEQEQHQHEQEHQTTTEAAESGSGEQQRRGLTAEGLPAMSKGFKTIYKLKPGGVRFAELVYRVAQINPEMRIRFTSPHPKDFPDDLLQVMKDHDNVCKAIHIPAQSGSSVVLEKMRRGYTRDAYMELIRRIRDVLPQASLSSDFISGFCGESETDHLDTLSLLKEVGYDQAFMFAYSQREKTHAHRNLADDVPEEAKQKRLREVVETFQSAASAKNKTEIGKLHLVLVQGTSKRSEERLTGLTDTFKRTVFPNEPIPSSLSTSPLLAGLVSAHKSALSQHDISVLSKHDSTSTEGAAGLSQASPGEYVAVLIKDATSGTLSGQAIARTTIQEFYKYFPQF